MRLRGLPPLAFYAVITALFAVILVVVWFIGARDGSPVGVARSGKTPDQPLAELADDQAAASKALERIDIHETISLHLMHRAHRHFLPGSLADNTENLMLLTARFLALNVNGAFKNRNRAFLMCKLLKFKGLTWSDPNSNPNSNPNPILPILQPQQFYP